MFYTGSCSYYSEMLRFISCWLMLLSGDKTNTLPVPVVLPLMPRLARYVQTKFCIRPRVNNSLA